MLLNIKKLLENERQLRAVIGMCHKKFTLLHTQFSNLYSIAQKKKARQRAVGGGRRGVIRDTRAKLLFILMYVNFRQLTQPALACYELRSSFIFSSLVFNILSNNFFIFSYCRDKVTLRPYTYRAPIYLPQIFSKFVF